MHTYKKLENIQKYKIEIKIFFCQLTITTQHPSGAAGCDEAWRRHSRSGEEIIFFLSLFVCLFFCFPVFLISCLFVFCCFASCIVDLLKMTFVKFLYYE